MPEPTPAPAPVADAPSPAPTPTPEAAPTPPTSKELSSKLFNLLTAPAGDPIEPAKPEKKKEAAPAPVPAAAAPAAPDKKATTDRQIRRSKTDEPAPEAEKPLPVPKKQDVVKKASDAPAAPAPAAPAEPARKTATEQTDADFEKDLIEEERALLDDARDAERLLGDKYKGHGQKMASFLKDSAAKAKLVEEGKLDEAEFQKWYNESRPKIGVLDSRKMSDARIEEQVNKRVTPKIEEERHARWVDAELPKVKAKGTEVYNKLVSMALPEEVTAAIAERTKGITDPAEHQKKVNEVKEEFAVEFEVSEAVFNQAADDIEEFHALTTSRPGSGKTIKALHPESQIYDAEKAKWVPNIHTTNPEARRHAGIIAMVNGVCDVFKVTGGAALKNDKGQWFATREEMAGMDEMVKSGELPASERAKFWTFTDPQIIEHALGNVKGMVKSAVQERLAWMKKRGFVRETRAAQPAPPSVVPISSSAPAAPRPSPAPGPGGPAVPSIGSSLASKLTSQPTA